MPQLAWEHCVFVLFLLLVACALFGSGSTVFLTLTLALTIRRTLTLTRIRTSPRSRRVPELARSGLWGIEAFSSEIDEANHAVIERLARQNNLVMTGGSDNHGTLKVSKMGRLMNDQPAERTCVCGKQSIYEWDGEMARLSACAMKEVSLSPTLRRGERGS